MLAVKGVSRQLVGADAFAFGPLPNRRAGRAEAGFGVVGGFEGLLFLGFFRGAVESVEKVLEVFEHQRGDAGGRGQGSRDGARIRGDRNARFPLLRLVWQLHRQARRARRPNRPTEW